jgi:predicted esterase YcpF (UPF0227 family)
MHIYIHGFASSGNATKGNILKDFYAGRETVFTPDFPDEPFEAVKLLESLLIESTEPVTLWGSSLGGFYAMYLTSILDVKSVLINPAIKPHLGLKEKVGKVTRHNSSEEFEWKDEYITQLKKLSDAIFIENIRLRNITLLLSKDDDVLDYKETLEYLDGKIGKLILEENAGHQFMTFKDVLEKEFK